jgi:AcrR family transcriptional regulator
MTPSQARGRPRSEERRDAVLKAAMELMQEDDLRMASVDRISARSGVSKATIYKWWPNRTAVAIDAFLHQMMADAPVPDSGSAAEDFRVTLRGMMGFPRGELDPNIDPEVALDLIFGPAMYRMAIGHGSLTPADADAIVATAMRALAS